MPIQGIIGYTITTKNGPAGRPICECSPTQNGVAESPKFACVGHVPSSALCPSTIAAPSSRQTLRPRNWQAPSTIMLMPIAQITCSMTNV